SAQLVPLGEADGAREVVHLHDPLAVRVTGYDFSWRFRVAIVGKFDEERPVALSTHLKRLLECLSRRHH
ncbi:hypothetical protein PENTCL1PPCAC_122, partial [Pristionchus entomophagus]